MTRLGVCKKVWGDDSTYIHERVGLLPSLSDRSCDLTPWICGHFGRYSFECSVAPTSHSVSPFPSLFLSVSQSPSLSVTLSFSLCLTQTHTLSHVHTHTHTRYITLLTVSLYFCFPTALSLSLSPFSFALFSRTKGWMLWNRDTISERVQAGASPSCIYRIQVERRNNNKQIQPYGEKEVESNKMRPVTQAWYSSRAFGFL